MNQRVLNSLFKPFIVRKTRFTDFLDGKNKRNFYKHKFWFECCKSINESCINTKCIYNYFNVHDNELYIELRQEIDAEKSAIKKKN